VTASFFKELARRTVLIAAEAQQPVDNAVLADAVTEMLSDTEQLTRALLGGISEGQGIPAPPDAGHWDMRAGPGLAP